MLFDVNSMKEKLMRTCSRILSKHTSKNLSVDAGLQKAKGFFKTDALYRTVKKQAKPSKRLEQ